MPPFAYVIVAIVQSALAGVIYKTAVHVGCRRSPLIAVERLAILVFISLYSLQTGSCRLALGAILIGLMAGVAVFLSRIFFLKALRFGGAGISYTIWNLSFAIPVLLSILIWAERPTFMQLIGLILVPLGIGLMQERTASTSPTGIVDEGLEDEGRRRIRAWFGAVLACFVLEGLFALSYKLLKEYDLAASQNLFIFIYNFVALLLSGSVVVKMKSLPRSREIAIAIPSALLVTIGAIAWTRGVIALPAIIFMPTVTAGGIVLMVALSRLIWKERLTRAQLAGVALSLVTVVLISVPIKFK